MKRCLSIRDDTVIGERLPEHRDGMMDSACWKRAGMRGLAMEGK